MPLGAATACPGRAATTTAATRPAPAGPSRPGGDDDGVVAAARSSVAGRQREPTPPPRTRPRRPRRRRSSGSRPSSASSIDAATLGGIRWRSTSQPRRSSRRNRRWSAQPSERHRRAVCGPERVDRPGASRAPAARGVERQLAATRERAQLVEPRGPARRRRQGAGGAPVGGGGGAVSPWRDTRVTSAPRARGAAPTSTPVRPEPMTSTRRAGRTSAASAPGAHGSTTTATGRRRSTGARPAQRLGHAARRPAGRQRHGVGGEHPPVVERRAGRRARRQHRRPRPARATSAAASTSPGSGRRRAAARSRRGSRRRARRASG